MKKARRRARVVVFMASPALVKTLDAISDEELSSRSAVVRRRMERVAANWRKARGRG